MPLMTQNNSDPMGYLLSLAFVDYVVFLEIHHHNLHSNTQCEIFLFVHKISKSLEQFLTVSVPLPMVFNHLTCYLQAHVSIHLSLKAIHDAFT